MNKRVANLACSILFITTGACKKPYLPTGLKNAPNYLVVEGFINSSADSTIIRLSRTVNVAADTSLRAELNAVITVESNQNENYPLTETGKGYYSSAGLNVDSSKKYRLKITTIDKNIFVSDYTSPQISPPIDSVTYNVKNKSLLIDVTSHNAAGNSRYYRYTYKETWQFNSRFISYYKIVNARPVYRNLSTEGVFNCWGNDSSSSVLVASSANLGQNIIYKNLITEIPLTSEKLLTRYSILVKQFSCTQPEYAYFTALKKNTESLGSIFDSQPSIDKSNIHCVNNADIKVVGYVGVSAPQQKRIFIDHTQIPVINAISPFYTDMDCKDDTVTLHTLDQFDVYYGGDKPQYLPIDRPNFAAPAICVDCTLRGTNNKPEFWK